MLGDNAGLNLFYGGTDGTSAPLAGSFYALNRGNNTKINISGANPSLKIGNQSYTVINSTAQLQAMPLSSGTRYAIGEDLSLAGTTYNTAYFNGSFAGVLDGLGHEISGLKIRTNTAGSYGLFSQINGGTVRHLGVVDGDIQINSTNGTNDFRLGMVAGLVGGLTAPTSSVTTLDGVWSSGVISASPGSGTGSANTSKQRTFFAGGLVGSQNGGRMVIVRSSSVTNVSAQGSHTTGGTGSGGLGIGGLVGDIGRSADNQATAATQAQLQFDISKSYSAGSIVQGTYAGYYAAGGLIGVIHAAGNSIADSFSHANVVGTGSYGGLVGWTGSSGNYTRLYTTQSNSDAWFSPTNSYTGSTLSAATQNGTALPAGWSGTTWNIGIKPTLKFLPTPKSILYVKPVDPTPLNGSTGTSVYGNFDAQYQIVDVNGAVVDLATLGLSDPTGIARFSLDNLSPYSLSAMPVSYLGGLSLSGANAANYILNPYSLAYTYSISKAPLIITANNLTRPYDGSPYSGGNGVTYSGFMNGETPSVLGGSLSYGGSSQGAVNAGTFSIIPGGFSANNYALTYGQGTLTITQVGLTLITGSLTGLVSKVYDGSNAALLSPSNYTLSGFVGSDGASVTKTVGSYSDANAGTAKTVTVSLSASDFAALGNTNLSNYSLPTSVSGTVGEITPATLTLSNLTASHKVYDGSTTAQIATAGTLAGVLGNDQVSYAHTSATFADRHVGTGKTVSVDGITLTGPAAANYSVASATTTSADITPKPLSLDLQGQGSKVYDGTTGITLDGLSPILSGVILNEQVAVGTGAVTGFTDKNAGQAKAVTFTGFALTGADAGNYSLLSGQATSTAEITPKSVMVSGITAQHKVYDSTTAATVSVSKAQVDGMIEGDVVSVSAVGEFADKNAGTGKQVNLSSVTLAGDDASNYTVSGSSSTPLADISPKPLGLDLQGQGNKVYDGSTSFAFNGLAPTLSGVVQADQVSVGTGAVTGFADKNVGQAKTVTFTGFELIGADASNYSLLSGQASSSAEITPKSVTVSGLVAQGKVYDGTTAATVSGSQAQVDGLIEGDAISVSALGEFADKHAGLGKTVNLASVSLAGADAANYTLVGTGPAPLADISPKALSLDLQGQGSKVYDGSTRIDLNGYTPSLSGVLPSDQVGVGTGAVTGFTDKNAGQAKAVTFTGFALTGVDADNYRLISGQAQTTADISPKLLAAVTGLSAQNKVYDGNSSATVGTQGLQFEGAVAGDELGMSVSSAQFSDRHVGTGKSVSLQGLSLTGADAANYILPTQTLSSSADISRLGQVRWIGGPEGNWFDPANWEGGAVPDRANVAKVILPEGVTASFDLNGFDPSNAPVELEELGRDGSLHMKNGALNIGSGGMQLDTLQQEGGTLTVAGQTHLNTLRQSGGEAQLNGGLTVLRDFEQSGNGRLRVRGDVDIADTQGGVMLGDFEVDGDLRLQSLDGDIRQGPGSRLVVKGDADLKASRGTPPIAADIVLDGENNDFQGRVSADGANVALRDLNALTLGTVTATANLSLRSEGALTLGTTTVGGALSAVSASGGIRQQGRLIVAGEALLDAGVAEVTLENPGNQFNGKLTLRGSGRHAVKGKGTQDISPVAGALRQTTEAGVRPPAAAALGTGGSPAVLNEGPAGAAPVAMAPSGSTAVATTATNGVAEPGSAAVSAPSASMSAPVGAATADASPATQAVSVVQLRPASAHSVGLVRVEVPVSKMAEGFTAALPASAVAALGTGARAEASLPDGQALPAWLQFDRQRMVFFATQVPPNALPLLVAVRSGATSLVVQVDQMSNP